MFFFNACITAIVVRDNQKKIYIGVEQLDILILTIKAGKDNVDSTDNNIKNNCYDDDNTSYRVCC